MNETLLPYHHTMTTIAQESADLYTLIAQSGGEITPDIEEKIKGLGDNFVNKVDSNYRFKKRLEMDVDYLTEVADQYYAMAKFYKSIRDRVHEEIKASMRILDKNTVSGNFFKFTLSPAKPSLHFVLNDLPDEFTILHAEHIADKEKILTALNADQEVPGAWLKPSFALRGDKIKGAKP